MGIEIVEGKTQKNEEFVFHIIFLLFYELFLRFCCVQISKKQSVLPFDL